jgi:hypothetical protein
VALRTARRSPRLIVSVALAIAVPIALGAQAPKTYAPESFRANGQILGAAGGAASAMTIAIDKYTADADHQKLAETLKTGGYAAFVAALKKAPAIGKLTIGNRTFTIRWARTVTTGGDHRRVAAVTDTPVFFAGAGAVDAKPTAGYDIGAIEFTVDSVGLGKGTMAPAAKVKAGGETGVEVEDYSGKRIELVTVTRQLK